MATATTEIPAPPTSAMRLTITRESLQEGLAAVQGSIPKQSTLPVLSCVLLEAADGRLRITATDLDHATTVSLPAEVSEPGAICVSAKKLRAISKEAPPAPIDLALKGESLAIAAGRSRYRLNGLPAEEFPALPEVPDDAEWKITAGTLSRLGELVTFCASTEETRPIINGVLVELEEGRIQMVATNGHKLARHSAAVEGLAANTGAEIILHPRALRQVGALFGPEDELEVSRSENHVTFRGPAAQLITRLVEGPYPDYRAVLPKENDKEMLVERFALAAAVRRMAILTPTESHRLRASFGGSALRLSAQSPDQGEASEELPVEYEGEPIEVGLSSSYLLEVLKHVQTEEVRVTLRQPETALTFELVGNEDTPDGLYILMPLRLLD